MKTLLIRWQRLINKAGKTCKRCDSTGKAARKAFEKLRGSLAPLGVRVKLETAALGLRAFAKDPLQSNRVWIGGRPLEEWLGAGVGKSRCCAACAGAECRTVSVEGNIHEVIPEGLIIRAGLLAAAELLRGGRRKKTRKKRTGPARPAARKRGPG